MIHPIRGGLKMDMTLEHVLKVLDLTEEQARGLLPLTALVQMSSRIVEDKGEEWFREHRALLREQWLYVQSL